jgi:SPP1 gp7 family putative phage head morphogenesis protein
VSGAASAQAIGLPFDEAIAFFRNKLSVPTPRWNTLWRDQHAAAFTVAGAMSADLLADIRAAVDKALAEGGTLAEFRRDFDEIVQRRGWRHKGKPGWRARVIFETNLRTAYAAGAWQQAQDTKDSRPFLRYSAILDNRTRPLHRQWHGTTLPIDHPFWRTHYPPNGWGCRCTVITLSQAQLDARGWKVTDPAPLSGGVPRRVRQPDGTERIEEVPPGVDPAWAYNVGRAAWGERLDRATMDAWARSGAASWKPLGGGDWRSEGRPDVLPATTPRATLGVPAADLAALAAAIERVIGGPTGTLQPPAGPAAHVTAAALAEHLDINRAVFVPLLREVVEDPQEQWLSFERHELTGKVVLRQRFVSRLALGPDRGFVAVAQVVAGRLEAWTFVPIRRANELGRSRIGTLVWAREEEGDRTEPTGGPPDDG